MYQLKLNVAQGYFSFRQIAISVAIFIATIGLVGYQYVYLLKRTNWYSALGIVIIQILIYAVILLLLIGARGDSRRGY